MDKYKLLNELKEKYGDQLIEEIAKVVDANGQGDCYGCLCEDYCQYNTDGTCIEAIKLAVIDILGGKIE